MSEDLTKRLTTSDSEKLNLILTTIERVEDRFNNFEDRFNKFQFEVAARFDQIDQRFEVIEQRIARLEKIVEHRLYDTRPIWHKVVADLAQLQTAVERLEQGQGALRAEVLELGRDLGEVKRDQIVINDSIRRIHVDFHTIDNRLHRLELNRPHASP